MDSDTSIRPERLERVEQRRLTRRGHVEAPFGGRYLSRSDPK
jgi:hypothetical protein